MSKTDCHRQHHGVALMEFWDWLVSLKKTGWLLESRYKKVCEILCHSSWSDIHLVRSAFTGFQGTFSLLSPRSNSQAQVFLTEPAILLCACPRCFAFPILNSTTSAEISGMRRVGLPIRIDSETTRPQGVAFRRVESPNQPLPRHTATRPLRIRPILMILTALTVLPALLPLMVM